MYTVSTQWLAALAASHTIDTIVTPYYQGVAGSPIPISDGTVTVDRGATCWRTLSLTVADTSLLPWDSTDTLAPTGQTLVIQQGIKLGGAYSYVPLGTFYIDNPTGDVSGLSSLTLTGSSGESIVQASAFTAATSTRGYSSSVSAITAMIRAVVPGATVTNETSDGRNPTLATQTWDAGTSTWDAVTAIAQAMSAEVGCDATGAYVIRDIPNPAAATSYVWEISAGGVMLSDQRAMTSQDVYNGVLVTGANASDNATPVSALVTDNDPSSPTLWGGPFGKRTKQVSSPLLTTSGACTALATALLADAIAPNATGTLTSVPNPALDCGDILRIGHPDGRLELAALQSVTIPLVVAASQPSTVTLRGAHTDDTGS
jgi:hypothetical protein